MFCFIDNKVIPTSEAHISVMDTGMLRGFGVYDGVSVVGGKGIDLQAHIDRFRSSATGLALILPYTDEQLHHAVTLLSEKMNAERFNIRLILTGGDLHGGLDFDPQKPSCYIVAEPYTQLSKEHYTLGSVLVTHSHARQYPQWKTINYITAVLTNDVRKKAGAVDVLYIHDGNVLECATSNVFIVKNGILMTPSRGILGGITRKKVLEIADSMITEVGDKPLITEIHEKEISSNDIFTADEVFITGSFKDIVPIVTVDSHTIGNGKVGIFTQALMAQYAQYIHWKNT